MSDKSKREVARRFFMHSPDAVSKSYVEWARKLKSDPGVTYGGVLDKHIIPLHPGDLMTVVARPGHGKTSFLAHMAKRAALDIVKRGAQEKECVVYVSWEQTIEEIDSLFQSGKDYSSTDMAWGRVPMEKIEANSIKRISLPIWPFGESKRHEGSSRPRMTIDYVYEAVEAMQEDYGRRPVLMCLDYIQNIPVDSRRNKTEQVDEAANGAKELAVRQGLRVVAGVQASRDVDSYREPIPTMKDAQHSSSIEQISDKMVGIWRPYKTLDPDTTPTIDVGGRVCQNVPGLFVVRLLKQRFDQGYGTWPLHFKPETLELSDYTFTPQVNGARK